MAAVGAHEREQPIRDKGLALGTLLPAHTPNASASARMQMRMQMQSKCKCVCVCVCVCVRVCEHERECKHKYRVRHAKHKTKANPLFYASIQLEFLPLLPPVPPQPLSIIIATYIHFKMLFNEFASNSGS